MAKLKKVLQREKQAQKLQKVKAGAEKRRQEIEQAKKAKKQTHQVVPPKPPFQQQDKLLLVGEGDFSFAYSLVANGLCENVIATAYDSENEVREKYPSTVNQTLDYLQEKDSCQLLYGIDATVMSKNKQLKKLQKSLDVVMFNFPHLGNSVKDQARNILQHQKLVLGYFNSALELIKPGTGRIVLTLFEGEPYLSWNVKKLARSVDLKLEKSSAFHWESYPGYNHRLTAKEGITSKPQSSRPARAYVFAKS